MVLGFFRRGFVIHSPGKLVSLLVALANGSFPDSPRPGPSATFQITPCRVSFSGQRGPCLIACHRPNSRPVPISLRNISSCRHDGLDSPQPAVIETRREPGPGKFLLTAGPISVKRWRFFSFFLFFLFPSLCFCFFVLVFVSCASGQNFAGRSAPELGGIILRGRILNLHRCGPFVKCCRAVPSWPTAIPATRMFTCSPSPRQAAAGGFLDVEYPVAVNVCLSKPGDRGEMPQ